MAHDLGGRWGEGSNSKAERRGSKGGRKRQEENIRMGRARKKKLSRGRKEIWRGKGRNSGGIPSLV